MPNIHQNEEGDSDNEHRAWILIAIALNKFGALISPGGEGNGFCFDSPNVIKLPLNKALLIRSAWSLAPHPHPLLMNSVNHRLQLFV